MFLSHLIKSEILDDVYNETINVFSFGDSEDLRFRIAWSLVIFNLGRNMELDSDSDLERIDLN